MCIIVYINKPVIKSSSCYAAVSESRRCCECDTAVSVNGLMRADENILLDISSYRRGAVPLSAAVALYVQRRVGAYASIWVVPQDCCLVPEIIIRGRAFCFALREVFMFIKSKRWRAQI